MFSLCRRAVCKFNNIEKEVAYEMATCSLGFGGRL